MDDRITAVRRALLEAPADEVVERLTEQLGKRYDVSEALLYLVDYRLAALLPLAGGKPLTRPGEPAWRCFDHQHEVRTPSACYLPVTARGERLGVLRLARDRAVDEDSDELTEIATLLAHELVAARPGTDRYAVAARTRRLTLAAELQWELLPGRSRTGSTFNLAGQLEPAYAVRGDAFDWAQDADRLFLTVVNGMGEGITAALLTSLAINAARNARRAGLGVAGQAELADQALYAEYRGGQHVEAILLELDLAAGRVTAVDAGSPRLILLRDGRVTAPPLEAQFPLGMFDGTRYRPQRFDLRDGDRLFVVSDGIFDAAAESTVRYGESALDRFVQRTRTLEPLQAVRSLLGDLRAFVGGELVDDAVAVCLDWTAVPR